MPSKVTIDFKSHRRVSCKWKNTVRTDTKGDRRVSKYLVNDVFLPIWLTLARAAVGSQLKTTMTLAGVRAGLVAANIGAFCNAFRTLVDVWENIREKREFDNQILSTSQFYIHDVLPNIVIKLSNSLVTFISFFFFGWRSGDWWNF